VTTCGGSYYDGALTDAQLLVLPLRQHHYFPQIVVSFGHTLPASRAHLHLQPLSWRRCGGQSFGCVCVFRDDHGLIHDARLKTWGSQSVRDRGADAGGGLFVADHPYRAA